VEAACAELGVDYETRDLDAREGEHRGAAYAAITPHRKMPALEIDGEVITETVAIVITLDERHGGLLPPAGSAERAQALRWMCFLASEVYPLVEMIDHPERFSDSPEVVRERAQRMTRERWALLEGHLAGPYLLASGFCAADLYVTKLAVWVDADWRRAHLPKVQALVDAVRARPSLAAVWARHIPPRIR